LSLSSSASFVLHLGVAAIMLLRSTHIFIYNLARNEGYRENIFFHLLTLLKLLSLLYNLYSGSNTGCDLCLQSQSSMYVTLYSV
jgi:hypothetical protein